MLYDKYSAEIQIQNYIVLIHVILSWVVKIDSIGKYYKFYKFKAVAVYGRVQAQAIFCLDHQMNSDAIA